MLLLNSEMWIILLSNLMAKYLLSNSTMALLKEYNKCQYYQTKTLSQYSQLTGKVSVKKEDLKQNISS